MQRWVGDAKGWLRLAPGKGTGRSGLEQQEEQSSCGQNLPTAALWS
jgi:hypothetical protein